ncbi:MAG: T9SS type A sorting domain-containing protein [Paludibacteraceae bacterium]
MKKGVLIFTFIIIAHLFSASYAQNKFYSFYDLSIADYVAGVSSNGKYVVTGNGFLVKLGVDTTIVNDTYEVTAVADNGAVVGNQPDPSYVVNGETAVNAAVWKDGGWHSLGGGQLSLEDMKAIESSSNGSSSNAITPDGKTIVGMTYTKGGNWDVAPFRWKIDDNFNVIDTVTYNYPRGSQGARFLDIADDGIRGCGWAVTKEDGGMRTPIVFKSPTEYKLIAPGQNGEANGISPNGKYVAFSAGDYAGMYDMDKDAIYWCGKIEGTIATQVSDNGIVVGYRSAYSDLGEMLRFAFIWSEKIGYVEMPDFFKTYAPDITLPDNLTFTENAVNVPMGISADGKTIGGWIGYGMFYRWGWALQLENAIVVPQRPTDLTASADVEKRNEVTLNWDIINDPENVLTGFKVFRNDVLLAEITDPAIKTYVEQNAPSGKLVYRVKAVYSTKDSPYSDFAQVAVVDTYTLPLSEDFESKTYDTNYWTTSYTPGSYNKWNLYEYAGVNYTTAAMFYSGGAGLSYQSILKSRPIDATGASKVQISFLQKFDGWSIQNNFDTLNIEVSNDLTASNWTMAKQFIVSEQSAEFTTKSIDLSDLAAGKKCYVRFRMVGKDNNSFAYTLDNIAIVATIPDAPIELKVKKVDATQALSWQDPTGSDALTYNTSGLLYQSIGDAGVPFIAVNHFDAEDLTALKGKYLTSISAYINQGLTAESGATPTVLKLAVFVDDVQVSDQEVASFVPNKWNTFKLDVPVAIPEGKTLKFGINVAQHDAGEYPLYVDMSETVDGKGNVYTEDGGVTWLKLSDSSLEYNWCIIGNVRETPALNERADLIGYEVYRGTKKINEGYLFSQTFTDIEDLTEACYTVKAYYSSLGASDASEEVCFSSSGLKDLNASKYVIPSLVHNGFKFDPKGNTVRLKIMNMNGVVLQNEAYSQQSFINFSNYAKGIYLVTVSDETSSYSHKLIKN